MILSCDFFGKAAPDCKKYSAFESAGNKKMTRRKTMMTNIITFLCRRRLIIQTPNEMLRAYVNKIKKRLVEIEISLDEKAINNLANAVFEYRNRNKVLL